MYQTFNDEPSAQIKTVKKPPPTVDRCTRIDKSVYDHDVFTASAVVEKIESEITPLFETKSTVRVFVPITTSLDTDTSYDIKIIDGSLFNKEIKKLVIYDLKRKWKLVHFPVVGKASDKYCGYLFAISTKTSLKQECVIQ